MTSVMVPVLEAASSKSEEAAALVKMRTAAGRGSYLASLFSDKLVDWVNDQMASDLPCDIVDHYEYLVSLQTRETVAAKHQVEDLQVEVLRLRTELRKQAELLEGNKAVIEGLQARELQGWDRATAAQRQAEGLEAKLESLKQLAMKCWLAGCHIEPEEVRSILQRTPSAPGEDD